MTLDELKAQKLWFLWNYAPGKSGKKTKVPMSAGSGVTGSSDNFSNTWVDYKTAVTAKEEHNASGIGFKVPDNYRVTVIDLEPVVYRDFGNGFNVEISGMYTTSKRKKATIYLWHEDKQPDCIIVKTIHDVCREDIGSVVEKLHDYSEDLIRAGKDNRECIFNLKFKAWNMAKGGTTMTRKIIYGSAPKFTESDRRYFDRGNYSCKALLQDRKGRPVVISQNKDKDLPIWKVEFGFCSIFFGTYEEAIAYCRGRFPDSRGKAV